MKDIQTLPKWAQKEILHRDRRIEELEDQLEAVAQTLPESRVQVNPFGHDIDHYLPDRETIRFHLGPHEYIDVSVRDDFVQLYASQCITINPCSGNACQIKIA